MEDGFGWQAAGQRGPILTLFGFRVIGLTMPTGIIGLKGVGDRKKKLKAPSKVPGTDDELGLTTNGLTFILKEG